MSQPVYILGVNAYHGDAAAVLLRDGVVVAAVEEERLRRVKHWAGFPTLAIRTVLRAGGIRGAELAAIAVGRNPRAHVARKVAFALRHRSAPKLIAERLRHARAVHDIGGALAGTLDMAEARLPPVYYVEHHRAHLASAFFVSPFREAACAAVDGFGDFVSTSAGVGREQSLQVFGRVHFPHSLGMLYTAITQYLGFPSYGDEYKVMALAAYGRPSRVREMQRLVRLTEGGTFELSLPFFRHWSTGASMQWSGGAPMLERVYTAELERLLGPSRALGNALEARHADIACSLQAVYETSLMHVLDALWERTRIPRLCLAGGCALNAVANGKIRVRTPFREVYIPPAAGDAGTAVGAACDVWHSRFGGRRGFVMDHAFWGPASDEATIRAALDEHGATYDVARYDSTDDVARAAAECVVAGGVVGWYQGRMEWGARALGHRSIVADPRRADVRARINARMKGRESFRPFAPSIAVEAVAEYFLDAVPDPFMTQAYAVRPDKREVIPAVTHIDGSARLHAVRRDTEPEFYALIAAFERLTGVPVLLNTSLNEHEPIVDTPAQALDTFARSGLDAIVLGTTLVRRVRAPRHEAEPVRATGRPPLEGPRSDETGWGRPPAARSSVGRYPISLPESAKILILQLQQVGDSIVMSPVFRALRQRYPRAAIDVLTTPVGHGVHRKSPHIRRFHIYRPARGRIARVRAWAHVVRAVRRERYDCVIACANQVSRRYGVIAWLTDAPTRIGFDIGGARRLFTHRLEPRDGENVVRANLRLAAAVNAEGGDTRGELWYDEADAQSVDALLAARGVSPDRPIVVIHPGSNWQSKMWYGERWDEVAAALVADGMQPVLVGTARDAAAVEVVHQQTCKRLVSLVGEIDLCQLAALLARAGLFVGTDSGPRHVAAAVGCPRVTVMSSLDTPGRWSLDDRETVLRSDPPCAGCLQRYCAHRQCMQQITATEVVAACRRVLGVGRQQTITDLVYAST